MSAVSSMLQSYYNIQLRMVSTQPLAKYRIVDMTRVLAGPFATMTLGDLGADIIKVEKPGSGDETRHWGPPFITPSLSNYFTCCNRNKQSIAIDFSKEQGQHIIQQLVESSDVFVENFRPHSLSKYNLDYYSLKGRNPMLIYASLTGYGQHGPCAHKNAYDLTIAAEGGLMGITGPDDGPPVKVGVAITDICSGLYLYSAILAALLDRVKTGKGQYIDVSMFSSQLSVLANIASNYINSDIVAKRRGSSHPSIVPYQGFETVDGYIVLAANNDKQFAELAEALKQPELLNNQKFTTNELRVAHRVELVNLLTNIISTKRTKYWIDKAKHHSFSVSAVNNIQEAFKHPQALYSDIVKTVYHGTEDVDVKFVGHPVNYSNHSLEYHAPPVLGQHTAQLLVELGYTQEEICQLEEYKIIQSNQSL